MRAPKKVNRGNLQDVCVDTLVLVEVSRALVLVLEGKATYKLLKRPLALRYGMTEVLSTLVDKRKTFPTKLWGYVVFMSTCVDNSRMLTKEQAITLAGSQSDLARLLGISRGAVWKWKKIPQSRIWQLQLLRPEWFEVIN